MSEAFVIMQIGNEDLDCVYEEAIVPAIKNCQLIPRRVDRHNKGRLLKSEIVKFINKSEIIVADLTNERPNVYLEVGYAMGVDKFRNLILICRSDHLPENPDWKAGNPKVHFDLSGYDILFWDSDDLPKFQEELTKRIKRRRAIIRPTGETDQPAIDEKWLDEQRKRAKKNIARFDFKTTMEIASGIFQPNKPLATPKELLRSADAAQINTFGWPIGLVMRKDEMTPVPRTDGIAAIIHASVLGETYDYWALRKNGDFFTLKSIFEGIKDRDAIFIDTRIVRTTEAVMHSLRLYEQLQVDPASRFVIRIEYSGLQGKRLAASSPNSFFRRNLVIQEDSIDTDFRGTLQEAESQLTNVVKQLVSPLFELFDFTSFGDDIYESIVSDFIDGKIS